MIAKIVIIFFSFLVFAQCKPFDQKKIDKIGKMCRQQTGMDESLIDKALKKEALPSPTSQYLAFIECSYRKQGYLDEEDNIVYNEIGDMLKSFYRVDFVNTVLEPCKGIVNGMPGEKAYKVAQCIIDNIHVEEDMINNDINNEIMRDIRESSM